MKTFVCSFCRGGLIGGALYLDGQALTYKTNKLTVSPQYRNLVMPLGQIREISWKQILLPVMTVHMKNKEAYTFLMFQKAGFEKWFQEYAAK